MKAGEIGTFKIDVDLLFSGRNGSDVLIDIYTLPDLDFDGDKVNEISILLTHDGTGPLSWLSSEATAVLTFPAPLGDCAIYKQPTSAQIMVMPRSGHDRRAVLTGTIDVKEVLDHLISIGLVDADAWVAGPGQGVGDHKVVAVRRASCSSRTVKRSPAAAITAQQTRRTPAQ